uniref:DUF4789 domain-containing protein n=1 Tax=Cacopsylla melanoneura TaxID=428564 RepID=A0A8D9AI90_9HEMI
MNKWGLGSISNVLLASLLCYAQGAIVPPPWADPNHNPCASQPGGWQLIYWPADKKCYRIFQRGYPCPETMELSPGPDKGTPECNCPPGEAQHSIDSLCYPIFQQGPCEPNQYFAPEPDRLDRQRLARCVTPEPCTEINSVYHPRDKKCHQKFTKGPCAEGQLIALSKSSRLVGECRCDAQEMAEFYWEPGGTCHQHFTTGPCQERGGLFLPGGQCGCEPNMPHYHNASSRCYQLGGLGPCAGGHQFTVRPGKKQAECLCKEGYVKWTGDGVCYRPYTRGPCAAGHMYSVNHTNSGMEIGCIPVPCPSGKLYFPGGKGCHRVGNQGPCPPGQLVLFQDSVKTSVEGISYLGMCGCPRYMQENTLFPTPFGSDSPAGNVCGGTPPQAMVKAVSQRSKGEPREDICVNKRGMITWHDGTCRQLYAQGPCNSGEWVVPDRGKGQRQGRGWWKGKCECRPGYTVNIVSGPDNENTTLCQAPTVVLAKFLNNKTNSYKYKNKQQGQDTYQDESTNGNNRYETSNNNPTSQSKYTTKLSNVRNNSRVTKLSSLRSTEEDRTKLVPVRSGNERRNSRYKTNWETRELNRMKELQEKNRKEHENEKGQKGEQKEDENENKNGINGENNSREYNGTSNKGDNGNLHETANEEGAEKVSDAQVNGATNEDIPEQEAANNHIQTKDVSQDTTNEILRKINAINASHKQAGGTSRERSVSRRINSKELNVDELSNGEQRLLGSQENGGNHRKGRKYSTGNARIESYTPDESGNKDNLNDNQDVKDLNKDEETFRNLKTIQDDINEYIRQEQKRQEQEDRLKNHKIIDQHEEDVQEVDLVDTNSARPDVKDENEHSQSGTEEFDTDDSLVEVVNKTSDEDNRNNDENTQLEDKRSNVERSTSRNNQNIVDRRKNHKEEEQQEGDDEFEDRNSTETLIMVEDKKDLVDYEHHRKHIKDYVKPIIIFEQETY